VRTPRLNTMLNESNWGEIGKLIPLGAPASPAEIAAPILFLCSDMASHITGQTLLVDGGMAGVVNLPRLAVTGQ